MVRGLFINLDRMPGRRQRIEAEIRRFGLSEAYTRLSAIDGNAVVGGANAGAVGCFLSHLKAVETARRLGGIVHILEDDAILSARLKDFLGSPSSAAALDRFDLVFLDMWVYQDERSVRRYQEAQRQAGDELFFMDLRGTKITCADSYLVGPRSADKVAGLLSAEVSLGPRMAVDLYYSRLVATGQLSAAVVVPFLTCVDIDTGTRSSIQAMDREEQRRYVMLRTAFFVDRDRQPALALPPLDGSAAPPPGTDRS
jgi:hypothetical protein